MDFRYLSEKIKLSLQLYSFTLILPIIMTVIIILGNLVGIPMVHDSIGEALQVAWVDYYITGEVELGAGNVLKAYRIHAGIYLVCCFLALTTDN